MDVNLGGSTVMDIAMKPNTEMDISLAGGTLMDFDIGLLPNLTAFYRNYLKRTDIDNGSTDYIFDECHVGQDLWAKYYTQGFVCPAPMDHVIRRRTFPHIYKWGDYSFLAMNVGNSHSLSATAPHTLEFARSSNNWEAQDLIRIKCIDDGGMREIYPTTDGFFPWNYQLAYAGGKLYAIISLFNLTVNPPVYATDYEAYKIVICSSDDWGDTWSTLTDLDAGNSYIPISKPIIVGDEIWITAYNFATNGVTTQKSWILRWDYVQNQVGTKTQIDTAWTDLASSEPCILEYSPGYFMCVARINWNDNYPGNETVHKGSVIAYSTDGLDWSDYTFYDEGTAYPNQPHLFLYDGYVYLSRGASVMHGTIAGDKSEIEWINRITGQSPWYQNYIYTYRSFYLINWERYDPTPGYYTTLRQLNLIGSIDFVVLDAGQKIIGATLGYRRDTPPAYIGEPWVAIIKDNSVGSGPTYTERLVYVAEIPGDHHTSNEITLYNFHSAVNDRITATWLSVAGAPVCSVVAVAGNTTITFTAGAKVTNAKIVYEIIKP